jgi:hypothetical protein
MRTIRIELPKAQKVGTRDRNRSIAEDTIVLIGHKDESELPAFAERTFAPFIASSFLTGMNLLSVGEIAADRLARETNEASEETKFLGQLIDDANRDLGSIEIVGATAEVTYHGKALIKLRLEAQEHERRRVIILGDNKNPLHNLKSENVIEAVERKF